MTDAELDAIDDAISMHAAEGRELSYVPELLAEVRRLQARARRFEASEAGLAALVKRAQAAEREADRLRHGVAVEGDFVCPDSLRADIAEHRLAHLEDLFDSERWR